MFRPRFLLLMLLLTVHMIQSQSTDPEWTVLDVTTLPGHNDQLDFAFSYLLSPDESQLAWIEDQQTTMCVMAIPSQVKRCRAIPKIYPDLGLLNWSPDGQYIALRDGFGEFSWHLVYAPETDTYFDLEGEDLVIWSDIYWDPSMATDADSAANPVVYFMTYEGTEYTVLRKHWVLTGEEEIFDQRTVFNAPLILYAALPVSLDGTRFVFSLEDSWGRSDFEPGLWLVDITTLDIDQVVTLQNLTSDLSDDEWNNAVIAGMFWDRDQNRLIVPFESRYIPGNTYSVTSFDLETGEMTPLVTRADTLETTGEGAFHEGYLTPDAEFFFYFDTVDAAQPTTRTVFALPLGTSDREPIFVAQYTIGSCPLPSLLVTMGHEDGGEARRYLYQPRGNCP